MADAPHPEVARAVTHIRDRFGAAGLRDLISLAQRELAESERILAELADWEEHEDAEPGQPRA
ncbi:MAG: hypothetical protein ACRDYU_16360 [Actinomycetes bacterium]